MRSILFGLLLPLPVHILLALLFSKLLSSLGHIRANFRGDRIPQSFGVFIMAASATALLAQAIDQATGRPETVTWLALILGFGLLGLADDVWGDGTSRGFRGHARAALGGRITTGFVKAVAGVCLAAAIAWLSGNGPAEWLLTTCLIAMGANTINLLDLRPGRASAVFLVSAALLALGSSSSAWSRQLPPLAIIWLPTAISWMLDSRGRVMIGDAGSNLLGAALGLAIARASIPAAVKLIALIAMVAINLVSERVSLTRLIEANPLLRTVDRLTGVR